MKKRTLSGRLFTLICLSSTLLAQAPLPETHTFLQKVRANLKSDTLLLSQYTFLESETTRTLGKKGAVKREEKRVYEVFPGAEETTPYRRLVSKDGQAVSEKKLQKQDRQHQKRLEKARNTSAERRARMEAKEEAQVDEIFQLFQFRLAGREVIDGRQTILVEFEPDPSFRPRRKDIRPLKKIRGKAWVDEADFQLVRIEAELLGSISLGLGFLAKLHKGAEIRFQRRKLNDEIWLPAEAYFRVSGRILLLKGFRVEAVHSYSDYQKFSVESSVSFAGKPPP